MQISDFTLYGILQFTVLSDMCAAFALRALHNFQIIYGAATGAMARAQGQLPLLLPLAPPMTATPVENVNSCLFTKFVTNIYTVRQKNCPILFLQ